MKSALKKSAAAAAMCLAAIGAVHAATYSAATTGPYTAKTDFTVCSGGPCQNYTLAMTPSGSFTTSAPLAANLSRIGSRRHADPFASSRHPSSTRALRQIHSSIGLTAQCRWGYAVRLATSIVAAHGGDLVRTLPTARVPVGSGANEKAPDYVSNRRLNLV